jgi:hypothetical protein
MTEKYEMVDIHLRVTAEEFKRIENGYEPVEMGDREFIFMEDDCLYIYSFSGYGLYMVWFRPEEDGYVAYRLRVPKDPTVKPIVDNVSELGFVKSILRGWFRIKSF